MQNTDIKQVFEELEELAEAVRSAFVAVKDALDEIKEMLAEIVFAESEKYKFCLCVVFPPPVNHAVKLWRKNRALFRPYKRAKHKNNYRFAKESNL